MAVKTVQVRDGDTLAPGWHSWADATAGPVNLLLPVGSARPLTVQKLDTSTNPVVVSGLIRGTQQSITLPGSFDLVELEPDENGWWWLRGARRSDASIAAQITALTQSTYVHLVTDPDDGSITVKVGA